MRYLTLTCLFLASACAAARPEPAEDLFAADMMKAFPAHDGWNLRAKPQRFTPANLYELIDGEADLFVPYNFQYLLYGDYVQSDPNKRSMNVELYRMASPLDAFGIYGEYFASKMEPCKIGTEARVSSTQLLFYKNEYFVRLTASEKSDACKNAMLQFGEAVAAAIPGTPVEIPERRLLDVNGKIDGSDRYVGRSPLDLAFLGKALIADATAAGKPARIFVALSKSPEEAAAIFAKLEQYAKENGGAPESTVDCGIKTLRARLPKLNGLVAAQNASQVIGVCSLENTDDGLSLLRALLSAGCTSKPCESGK